MAEAGAIGPARRTHEFRLAGGWLLLALLAAIFAPLVAPHDPLAQDLMLSSGCRLSGCRVPSLVTFSVPTASAATFFRG